MTLWDDMVGDSVAALGKLEDQHEETLRRAWLRTVCGDREAGARQLVPFVGSGINALGQGGSASWRNLVAVVEGTIRPRSWTDYHVRAAQLSEPERLELALSRVALRDRDTVAAGVHKELCAVSPTPSRFHRELVRNFPCVVTTNYNDILLAAAEAEELTTSVLDATVDPDAAEAYLQKSAIVHLHGRWPYAPIGDDDGSYRERLFNGVGHDYDPGKPCIVLTEGQYQQMYAQSSRFQRIVRRTFAADNLLLFIGSGLSASEFGVHAYLRDLHHSGGHTPVGIYVGFDINPARAALLGARDLGCVSLSRAYGERQEIRNAVWLSFLEACRRRFGAPRRSWNAEGLPVIDVVSIGIASRQSVLLLGKRPTEESGNMVSGMVDEASGQHLLPTLVLADRGTNVALVTRLGEDADGDWVLSQLRELSGTLAGRLDTQGVFRQVGRGTRRTVSVTYPTHPEATAGTRTNYDWEDAADGDWMLPLTQELSGQLATVLQRHRYARALYIGPLGHELSALVLDIVRSPFRFLETSSRGPVAAEKFEALCVLAKECTHVLASAKFVFRVLGLGPEHTYDEAVSGLYYQEALSGRQEVLRECATKLFGAGMRSQVLVATLGHHGCLFVCGNGAAVHVADGITSTRGTAWIGCGDIFRGAFIHALLSLNKLPMDVTGDDLKKACAAGNRAGSRRILRCQSFAVGDHGP